jgi:hypothetical protein
VVGPGVVGRVVAAALFRSVPIFHGGGGKYDLTDRSEMRQDQQPTIELACLANAGWNEQAANLLQPKIDLAEIDHLA